MSNEIIYKVTRVKIEEEVGVGVEEVIETPDGPKVVFIASYYFGKASRREVFHAYVRKLIDRHAKDERITIKIADPNLLNKQKWLSDYDERITFKILSSKRYLSCLLLAIDAINRKNTIEEELI